MRRFDGKVAIVTGAASGIGKEIALRLAAEGGIPVIADLNLEAATAAAEIRKLQNGDAFAVAMNVTDEAAVEKGVADTMAKYGRIDILVSNAGIQIVKPVVDFDYSDWKKLLAIHLDGAFLTTKACVKHMYRQNSGALIYMGSVHSHEASPLKAAYVAAKHGIVGLTKVTALETAEANITCNAICPGYVYTPLVEAQIDGQARSHGIPREQVIRDVLLAQQPNKRFATVEELGALSVFLASDAAASITGTALPVDGGWTAH